MTDKNDSSAEKYTMLDCGSTDNILRMLDTLKTTPAGSVLYKQISHALLDYQRNQNKLSYGYAALAHMLMNAYRKSLPRHSLLYLELKIMQKRLLPPVGLSELAALYGYFRKVMPLLKELTTPDSETIRVALEPLLGMLENATVSTEEEANPPQTFTSDDAVIPAVEQHVNAVFKQRLSEQHRAIQAMQHKLTEKIDTTTRYHEEFRQLMRNLLVEIEQYGDSPTTGAARLQLAETIRGLLNRQHEMTHILQDTRSYLNLAGENSNRLSEELDKVRVLSLTDDLTGLPNRRAFMRRVDDEILRSDREKSPLTLIMMDIDNFKNSNDLFGHAAGDEILRVYAEQILTVFRRYDMVARYGGEEFAVILPGTDILGAQRALSKIQAKARVTQFKHSDVAMPVPTFSAGVAMHLGGESGQSLINRADKALYRAKEAGRDRVEFSQPTEVLEMGI